MARPAAALLALSLAACGDIASSSVRVIDGDTLVLAGQHVRLYGIDAPEAEQVCLDGTARFWNCGRTATAHLRELVGRRAVVCHPIERDIHGRTVATCATEAVADLGEAMVLAGLAVDYARYSGERYRAAEMEARAGRRGIWVGQFVPPKQWRAEHRKSSSVCVGAYRVSSSCVRVGGQRIHPSVVPLRIVFGKSGAVVLSGPLESAGHRRVEHDGGADRRASGLLSVSQQGADGGAGEASAFLSRRAAA